MGFNSAYNPSNTELNPICHLLALLGTHHILHVSRVRVKGLITVYNTKFYENSQLGAELMHADESLTDMMDLRDDFATL